MLIGYRRLYPAKLRPSPDDHEMNILPVAHAARRGQNASHVMAHPHIAGVQHRDLVGLPLANGCLLYTSEIEGQWRALRVPVVLQNEQHGQIPKRCNIEALVDRAFAEGPVPEKDRYDHT